MGFSIVMTIVSAFIAVLNPGLRWRKLRAAALNIESEIWQFRTRTGPRYRRSTGAGSAIHDEQLAKENLQTVIENIRSGVWGSADVKNSQFYRTYPPSIFTHGEREMKRKK